MAQRPQRKWTKDDIRFVCQNYGILTATQIGKVLGRTKNSVISKANQCGLTSDLNRKWRFEDTEAPKIKQVSTDEPIKRRFQPPYLSEFLDPIWRQKFVRGEVTWKSRGA